MKARKLKQLLNNTRYIISNNRDYIAIGSGMCHNLISVNKETLELKCALDYKGVGRDSLIGSRNAELIFIWDKLQELIQTGEILDIINGRDIIENPLPIFTVRDGRLIESVTDAYDWPNVDDNGELMYDNTHFKTKKEALEYGIKDNEAGVKMSSDRVLGLREEVNKYLTWASEYESNVVRLKILLEECESEIID